MILRKTIPKVELQTNIKTCLALCRTLPGLLLGFFGFDVTETKRSRNGISLPRKRTWDRDTSSLMQLLALPQGWFSFKIKFKNSLKIQFKLQTLNLNLWSQFGNPYNYWKQEILKGEKNQVLGSWWQNAKSLSPTSQQQYCGWADETSEVTWTPLCVPGVLEHSWRKACLYQIQRALGLPMRSL